MINPMPFCPSLDPCAKLTPVQVRISNERIQNGGGRFPSGERYRAGSRIKYFAASKRRPAKQKPIMGDSSKEYPILVACDQSTPLVVSALRCISWFINPTPIIDPITVSELHPRIPHHHVPTLP